jgi:ABC-2 type transport system permease protein
MQPTAQHYSQSRALGAITKASFKAIFSNPSAIIFSILFPIIFIMIFGAFGNGGPPIYRVALAPGCDTANDLFRAISKNPQVRIAKYTDTALRNKDLIKGRLTGILSVTTVTDSLQSPKYVVNVRTTSASMNTIGAFMQVLDYVEI